MTTETTTSGVDIDAIRQREQAAHPGPWQAWTADPRPHRQVVDGIGRLIANVTERSELPANAEFIAHARTDVPALLAKVAELTAERDAEHADAENLREALRDNDNCNDFLQRTVDGLRAELAAKDAVIEAAKEWRRAVAETGDYEISDSDVLIAAIDALTKPSEVAR